MDKVSAMKMLMIIVLSIILSISHLTYAEEKPPDIGNFALPSSQQPGTFYSFGQRILDKNDLQFYLTPGYLKTNKGRELDYELSLTYGLIEHLSLSINTSYADYRANEEHSNGFTDSLIQAAYAYYKSSNLSYSETGSIVLGLFLPTGSIYQVPPTGNGTTLFMGTTYNRTWVEWLFFGEAGYSLPLQKNYPQHGPTQIYQFGLGKNIKSKESKYILFFMTEFSGQYFEKGVLNNVIDPDSGGYIINIIPSIFYSTKHLILQLGLSLPLIQNWNGDQPRSVSFVSANIGWTF